jgi:hypothetical protein
MCVHDKACVRVMADEDDALLRIGTPNVVTGVSSPPPALPGAAPPVSVPAPAPTPVPLLGLRLRKFRYRLRRISPELGTPCHSSI